MNDKSVNYGTLLREGFAYLLENYPDVFLLGQGLWSPWYVGNSMADLDKKFGKDRIIDTPVSERLPGRVGAACRENRRRSSENGFYVIRWILS